MMWATWMPLGANSAFRVWQSMRRPPMAAAWECCPAFARTAAVAEVTKHLGELHIRIRGSRTAARGNRFNEAGARAPDIVAISVSATCTPRSAPGLCHATRPKCAR